uniref:B30.2/SPRY domain-containing protein n=1 Tax=Oreochromis aureus TaxID=47969 RepID=A0A668W3D0_OREAU
MKHNKPLELFCKTDQTCVYVLCSVVDHKTHEFVPMREEYEGKKAELGKTEGTVVRAVDQLKATLSKDMKKLFEAELKRVQQYAVDVTLDPDTAHPYLILSDDGKQVHCGEEENDLPDNPERFSLFLCVLGKQSFSSGRFYFEVQLTDKTKWFLGVCRESVNRKEEITLSPEKGYWTVAELDKNIYVALQDFPVRLLLQSDPEKVGVFVDYEEGLVSFHDVDDAALIYSFTGCSFTEKLYPFFCPCDNDDSGVNSAPLIICPVNQ